MWEPNPQRTRSRLCPFHSANVSVATSPTDPDERANIAQEQREGRAQRDENTRNVYAIGRDHSNLTKVAYVSAWYGKDRTQSIKTSFFSAVRPAYRQVVRDRVLEQSDLLRRLIIKLQLFVNHYVLANVDHVDESLFKENGFYSASQFVRGRQVTTTHQRLRQSLLVHWETFRTMHPSIEHGQGVDTHALASYLKGLATAYVNNFTVPFESRIKAYIRFLISCLDVTVSRGDTRKIVDFAYEKFAQREVRSAYSDEALDAFLADGIENVFEDGIDEASAQVEDSDVMSVASDVTMATASTLTSRAVSPMSLDTSLSMSRAISPVVGSPPPAGQDSVGGREEQEDGGSADTTQSLCLTVDRMMVEFKQDDIATLTPKYIAENPKRRCDFSGRCWMLMKPTDPLTLKTP
ncbi:hypothetical protein DM01DRAFT_1322500 [Hesseltinella vesiculosa]|uniref:Uncharacterized protein n=1 Tax=Hesseltinella vesiculosa TaxID=101127 RepID=A0A1X2GGU6_9FUNG|nr:hypothetical protein DM01DRAFT_1322500 [Hesseltinella vesiculosa]